MDRNTKKTVTEAVVFCCCAILPEPHTDRHEPPIGFGDGSLFVDIPKEQSLVDAGSSGGYFRYNITATNSEFTQIFKVAVMTELGKDKKPEGRPEGGVTFCVYQFERKHNAKLQMWLAPDKDTASFPKEPDVIVDGNLPAVLSKKPLNAETALTKKIRPKRRKHSETSWNVVKWNIVDENGVVITTKNGPLEAVNDDLYYFYVSFWDD